MNKYIGEIFMFGGTTPPPACIEAGGQAISRTTYADLFAVYGTTYGLGDGATTFNVPDLRGRVAAGPNTMGGATATRLAGIVAGGIDGGAIGNTGGEEARSIALHQLSAGVVGSLGEVAVEPEVSQGTGVNVFNAVTNAGDGDVHSSVQPTIIIPFLIYTGVS